MFRFLSNPRAARRANGAVRRARQAAPEVNPLETRCLLSTVPVISEAVSPRTLWPPNGRLVPVHVSGTIADPVPGVRVNSVQYSVVDSEAGGQILNGPVALVNGRYSFVVRLQARRAGQDFNGRQYTINIIATDTANNVNSDSAAVIVPHDQGHGRFGFGGGGNRGGRHLRIGPPIQNGNGPAHRHAVRLGPGPNRGDDFFNNQGDDFGPGNGHGHGNGNSHVNQGNGESGHDHGNGNGNGNDNGKGDDNSNGNGNGNGHGNHGKH